MNEIELVDIEKERVCKIRPEGINALKGENFPTQLGAQLIKYMRETVKLPFSSLARLYPNATYPMVGQEWERGWWKDVEIVFGYCGQT